jgi:hypothetical protein
MNVFEFLSLKMENIIINLEKELKAYQHEEHEATIQNTGAIFDSIRSYIQIQENLIFPQLSQQQNLLGQKQAFSQSIHEELENIMDSSVLMHVDEPSCEFKQNLEALLGLLKKYQQFDEVSFFPQAKRHLSPEDLTEIHQHLDAEMKQERLPAPSFNR